MNLFEIDKKEKFRKTVRILVYPNITFQKDLEKDSFIQVIKNQIKLLNSIRDDLWFYLILPEPIPSLVFENVSQHYVDFPTHPPIMRGHFDTKCLRDIVSPNRDFDLVMSHLPEHTHAVKNVLLNITHHVPQFFGYCHWFDLEEVVTWPQPSFNQNVIGLLEYDRCYLNTQHQKELVLKQSSTLFNDKTISKLDDILKVQHLGVNKEDIVEEFNYNPERIIVFNHRPDTYKHFNEFMTVMDNLWAKRKDFSVWIPLLEKPNREYVITEKGNKQWYYNKLKTCYMGFSPKQTYAGWSVATTDGMMNGVPYIMYDDTYYRELCDNGVFFQNDKMAEELLNKYLDSLEYRNEEGQKAIKWISDKLIYKDNVIEMSDYITDLNDSSKTVGDSVKLNEIISWIKTEKKISKKEIMNRLGWGRGIRWTPYRQALLKHPNIFDVMEEYPTYCWINP